MRHGSQMNAGLSLEVTKANKSSKGSARNRERKRTKRLEAIQ